VEAVPVGPERGGGLYEPSDFLEGGFSTLRLELAHDLNLLSRVQYGKRKSNPQAAPVVVLAILVHVGFIRFWPPTQQEYKSLLFLLRLSRGLTETTIAAYSNFLIQAVRASHPSLKGYEKTPAARRLVKQIAYFQMGRRPQVQTYLGIQHVEACRSVCDKPLSKLDETMIVWLTFAIMILARLGEIFGNKPETLRWRNLRPAWDNWVAARTLVVNYDSDKTAGYTKGPRVAAVGNAVEYKRGSIVTYVLRLRAASGAGDDDILARFPEDHGRFKGGSHIPMSFMTGWVDERLKKAGLDGTLVCKTGNGYSARKGGAMAAELAEP
jgi:hypothetical protein